MDYIKIYRLVVLAIVVIGFWIMMRKLHQTIDGQSSDAIHLPSVLGTLFSMTSSKNSLSMRGILGQLFISSIAVIFTLQILGYIANRDLAKYLGLGELIVSILSLLIFLFFRKKKTL